MKKYLFIAALLTTINGTGQPQTKTIPVSTFDTIAAWENGSLHFYNADIKTIMGAVSALYKVDIVYSGNLTGKKLTGSFAPDSDLPSLIRALVFLGINCKLTNGKVVVSP
jgi:transmembrane sensor